MPKAVVVLSSDGTKRNLSDETYASFTEPEGTVVVSILSGQRTVRRGSNGDVRFGVTFDRDDGPDHKPGSDTPETRVVILKPHPHVRHRRRPSNVTIKESLSADEVAQMLDGPSGWKLAVPSGSSTDVLTKDMLKGAWETDASGVVTLTLRGPTAGEQAVLDDAKERLSPKGAAGRVTAALGAPGAQLALLAAAIGGFFGLNGDEDIARPYLLVVAGVCALLAIVLSVIATHALRRKTISLSRLDLLQRNSSALGPPAWVPNVCIALFVTALILGFFSVVPRSTNASASPSFGQLATSEEGGRIKASFTVTWTNLGDEAAKVQTTLTRDKLRLRTILTPKAKDGTAKQEITITLAAPASLAVSTQALDAKAQPVSVTVTHTYKIP